MQAYPGRPEEVVGPDPDYPTKALERHQEATVVVWVTIDTLGRVTRAEIDKSGGTDFDRAVLKAVYSGHYDPQIRGGRRINAKFRRPFEFRLPPGMEE